MSVKVRHAFDIKFIGRSQRQLRNGEAAEPVRILLVEPEKLDIKRHLRGFLLIMHFWQSKWRKDSETN